MQLRVLVVGQTPPPHGGQAVMIQELLASQFENAVLFHVRMSFSDDMDSIGKFRWRKIVELLSVILRIARARVAHGCRCLYYPPAGPTRPAFFRDAAILLATRWMFRRTVFHFHAAGLSTLYPELCKLERFLFWRAYEQPDIAVRTSGFNPDDGTFIHARRNLIVENSVPDHHDDWLPVVKLRGVRQRVQILFVGAIFRSKGVSVLLDSASILKTRGLEFVIQLVGKCESAAYENELRARVREFGLGSQVEFSGVLTGDDKWRAYAEADIFCFPTFFESESFGLVNLEAMFFALPVVSTRWRGIPGVVSDQESGFLVDVNNAIQLADNLEILIRDSSLRQRMGQVGRAIALERFSIGDWRERMDGVFLEAGALRR
jgi:glycosyltransferase involved in cell wall biosynthesis